MAADKPTSTTTPAEPKKAARVKPDEVLKVAYTKRADNEGFVDFVIFGTDAARSEFLRQHADVWWRIADVAKGEILSSDRTKSNG